MKSRAWRSAAATLGCHRSTMKTTRGPSSGAPAGMETLGEGTEEPPQHWELRAASSTWRIPEARPLFAGASWVCAGRASLALLPNPTAGLRWKQQLLFSHSLHTLPPCGTALPDAFRATGD